MPITKKTILPLNLLEYDVFIEDTSQISEYFSVTNVPSSFAGGRNSFLIGGSSYLEDGSEIKLEILDSNGNPIYQSMVPSYVEGNSRMISVEIYDDTAPGFATIVLMGKAAFTVSGEPLPTEWQDAYNVRWTRRILVDYDLKNTSPIRFEIPPEVFVEEKRFYNINSSSYDDYTIPFTASLTPLIQSPVQIGYGIDVIAPSTFSADYTRSRLTGSLTINTITRNIDLPVTTILNKTKAFSRGYLISSSINDGIIKKLLLRSGSYNTSIDSVNYGVTSSVKLQYYIINTSSVNIPISYASLRISNLSTVSGEIHKLRVYSKVTTNTSDYKLVADVPIATEEILVSSSIRGNVPIGNIMYAENYQTNWYSAALVKNTGSLRQIYTVSGSSLYYNSYSASAAYLSPLTVNRFGGVVTGSTSRTFIKTNSGSATNGWNGQVYSSEAYSQSLYVSAKATSTTQSLMFGLNSDPTTDASTSSIDYGWYLTDAGNLQAYSSSVLLASYGTYTTSSLLNITYEDNTIKYFKDGILQRTASRAVGNPLYFDTSFFYTSSQGIKDVKFGPIVNNFTIISKDDILLSSIYANIPVNTTTNKFSGAVSESGYFLGTVDSYLLFPTTEYTLTFDAYYKNSSGSVTLAGNTPKVDIYILGVNGTKVVDNDPLGQKIGQLTVLGNSQWFESTQFNFSPNVKSSGRFGLRFVVSNGFWNFSNISIKPASDPQFSPDETVLIVPNLEYHNELLQYKVEFFDINNNSVNVAAISTPVFFTGSAIDLGTLS